MEFLGNTLLLSGKTLDYLWEKQRVIADNIANNDTPGFKGKYVTFEDELRSGLSKIGGGTSETVRKSIKETSVKVHKTTTESTRLDGNNVQTEAEFIELARAQLQYDYQIRVLNSEIAQLRTAIKG